MSVLDYAPIKSDKRQRGQLASRKTHPCYTRSAVSQMRVDGMTRRWLRSWQLTVGISVVLAVTASTAREGQSPKGPPSAEWLSLYADLVEETELRRRVNVLHPNPQSILDGLQAGYVSVRNGNLTFRRRDIVSGSGERIYFSRVYDSRIASNGDFGPGWRLSLAEELAGVDGGLAYTDRSGARHFFKLAEPSDAGLRSEPLVSGVPSSIHSPSPSARSFKHIASGTYAANPKTPRHTATSIEVVGGLAVIRDGPATRVFEQQRGGALYRLRTVSTGDGTLTLSYRNGRVSRVSGPAGAVFHISRDGRGRIVSVQDRWGRSVHYAYDAAGRLAESQDIAGHAWTYEYGPSGRLVSATGPNDRAILRISYDEAGRVARSSSGQEYSYRYGDNETVVTEGAGHVHVFGHDPSGITDRFESTNGEWWQLILDDRNRIVVVRSPEGERRYEYDPQDRITRVAKTVADGTESRSYQLDEAGRITGIQSPDGALTTVDYSGGSTRVSGPKMATAFKASSSGKIVQAERGGTVIAANYDPESNLSAFRSEGGEVSFRHDFMGRLSSVEYASGEVAKYQYDALGNRSGIQFSVGGTVRYAHDPAGNIVEVEVREGGGETKRQTLRVGDMNRVENITYEGLGNLDIAYDAMGRAVRFDTGSDIIAVEYAGPDRIARITSQARGAVWSPGNDRRGRGRSADARREVLQNDPAVAEHPHYGIVVFDGASFAAAARDPLELGIPGLRDARRMLDVAEPLLSGTGRMAVMEFEKPSNAVFQPLEYRSTNCCICIAVADHALSGNAGAPADAAGGLVCICLPDSVPPPPSVSIETSATTWHIDRTPSMPSIRFAARLHNVEKPQNPFFLWRLEMEFDKRSRETYKHVKTGLTTAPAWSPDWGRLLAGANKMTVSVTAVFNDVSLTASRSGYQIHAQNPTQAQIFSIATRLEHKAVAWQESSHRQFNAVRHTGIGLPLPGPPDGWGLMQLELRNPVENWGERELWDWRENLSEGVQYLSGRYAEAETYLNHHYGLAARKIDTSEHWPSNPADDPKNLWDDAFSRYNTGATIYSESGNKGARNCTAHPKGCTYAAAIRKHMKEKPWE